MANAHLHRADISQKNVRKLPDNQCCGSVSPGSGSGILDLGSTTHSEDLITILLIKILKLFVNLLVFVSLPVQKKNNFQFCEIYSYKRV
jgi:hypothetical protein